MSRITGKRSVPLTAFLVAVGCAVAGQHAAADTMALQDWSGSMDYITAPGANVGFKFTVDAPITVTKLGVFDRGADGLGESHAVGIWEEGNTTNLLATATVTTLSPLEGPTIDGAGRFAYEELSSALKLNANTSYRIAAYYTDASDSIVATYDSAVSVTTANVISFDSAHYLYTGGLAYPTTGSTRTFGYIGPSFQFVPEPGTLALLLSGGLAALVVLVRRRRSR